MEYGELIVQETTSHPFKGMDFLRDHAETPADREFHHEPSRSHPHNIRLHQFPTDMDVPVPAPKNVKLTKRTVSFGVDRTVVDYETSEEDPKKLDLKEPIFETNHETDYEWSNRYLKPNFSVEAYDDDD